LRNIILNSSVFQSSTRILPLFGRLRGAFSEAMLMNDFIHYVGADVV
jgi:hypothetical protein